MCERARGEGMHAIFAKVAGEGSLDAWRARHRQILINAPEPYADPEVNRAFLIPGSQ